MSVSFSFRVGIIAFLWLFLIKIFGSQIEATPSAFVYVFVGLIALGLARIEEVSQSRLGIRSPFNASWMGILAGSALVVLVLSLLVAWLFSFRNIAAVMSHLRPALALLGKIVAPVTAVFAWLLELLLTFLIRVFARVLGGGDALESWLESDFAEELRQLQEMQPAEGRLLFILQLIKWGTLVMFLATVLAGLAFAVNRRWRTLQGARSVEHESIWETESEANSVRDALESRWRRWREELQARLAQLRGEEYSLASIRQVYASLVKLATSSGLPRHEAETPYEYSVRLHKAFPESREEIRLITNAYVRAHYGERSFRPQYVQRVRDAWFTIRAQQEQSSGS